MPVGNVMRASNGKHGTAERGRYKSLWRVTNILYYSLDLLPLRGVDRTLMFVLVELRMIE